MKKLLFLSFLFLISVTGCTKGDGPAGSDDQSDKLELNSGMSENIVLDPEGSFTNLRFNAPADWHIEMSEDAHWVEISPMEGTAGKGRLKIKAEANETGEDRVGHARICSGDEFIELTVSQEKFVPKFELLQSEAEVSFLGGTVSVPLISNFEYEYECDADWVTFVGTKASGQTDILFDVALNDGPSSRTAVITFSSSAATLDFTVTQGTDGLGSRDWTAGNFVHRSLAMRFTATWCGYCPMMAEAFDKAKSQMNGALELVSLHAIDSDIPFLGTRTLANRFNISGYPTGIVDARASIPNYSSTTTTAKAAVSVANETQTAYPASVGIAGASAINGNTIDISVGLYVKEAGSYRVTVLVLEDGIVAAQNGGGTNYVHNDVARTAATSISGESVQIESNGQLWTKSYSVRLDAAWNPDNLKILIYVEKPFGDRERVRGVADAKYRDYGDTYIDNCLAVPVGQVGQLELK